MILEWRETSKEPRCLELIPETPNEGMEIAKAMINRKVSDDITLGRVADSSTDYPYLHPDTYTLQVCVKKRRK